MLRVTPLALIALLMNPPALWAQDGGDSVRVLQSLCVKDLTPVADDTDGPPTYNEELRPTPPHPRPAAGDDAGHAPVDEMDALRRATLSQRSLPAEMYANRVGPLPVRGMLMGEPYSGAMDEVFYWESFGTPRQRLEAMATEQGVTLELGEELDPGGMKRVFRARFQDYSGRWIEGVAKIYDRELVAKAFETTIDRITDQLMAMLIQRDQFIRKVTQEAAERFMYNYTPRTAEDGSRPIQRLSIYVPRSFANSTLSNYGIELQEIARGNPLHWAASTTPRRPVHTFTSMGLRSEYMDYQLFVEQLEADLRVLLAEFINKEIYQLFMKSKGEAGPPRDILDLSLDRNANVEFRVPTDGGLTSAVISPFDP